ncbi:TetR/AcrR family transcriptional regulator [Streptomyces sp. NBC_01304]|uniref:TetR/AcrR family transcriptional regulator n=1 Tax=Streptomyces sp. NBC_01304 TaxID=2903818 RepID=UPI002E15127A|nr:TetR/AcrR family transcriptional regulator [Streptomyces sp. NBC_01304]
MSPDPIADERDEFGIPIVPAVSNVSQRKRESIVEAATDEFLTQGYAAASVDTIASRAGVSKPTVYKHFGNKERLFLAVIAGCLPKTYADLKPLNSHIAEAPDLRAALIELSSEWARILLSDDIMRLRRLCIGEVSRFPQLGDLWYRVSYDMNNGPLIKAFTELDARGELDAPDPVLAVQQLVAVSLGVPQLVKTFRPDAEFEAEELTRVITSGVDTFLARYAPGRTSAS